MVLDNGLPSKDSILARSSPHSRQFMIRNDGIWRPLIAWTYRRVQYQSFGSNAFLIDAIAQNTRTGRSLRWRQHQFYLSQFLSNCRCLARGNHFGNSWSTLGRWSCHAQDMQHFKRLNHLYKVWASLHRFAQQRNLWHGKGAVDWAITFSEDGAAGLDAALTYSQLSRGSTLMQPLDQNRNKPWINAKHMMNILCYHRVRFWNNCIHDEWTAYQQPEGVVTVDDGQTLASPESFFLFFVTNYIVTRQGRKENWHE